MRVFRPRVLIYTAVLVVICGAFVTSLALRSPFRVDVVRDRGTLARMVGEGQIENVYRLQVMNATESVQHFRVKVEGIDGATVATQQDFELGPAEARWLPVSVQIDAETAHRLGAGVHPIRFEVETVESHGNKAEVKEKSTFVVPR